jgi:hypothetical protein
MKLDPKVFYNMTLREFVLARIGHQRENIEVWRQTRMMLYAMQSLLGDSKGVKKTLLNFLPLPFDEELKPSEEEVQSKEQAAKALFAEYRAKGILTSKPKDGKGTVNN